MCVCVCVCLCFLCVRTADRKLSSEAPAKHSLKRAPRTYPQKQSGVHSNDAPAAQMLQDETRVPKHTCNIPETYLNVRPVNTSPHVDHRIKSWRCAQKSVEASAY